MGQTLTNGIYLPDEGERNSYSGLEVNWRTLDALILTVNGKAAPNIANTWTAAQTFTAGITGDLTGNVTGNLTGTASKAIADEDGTSIKTGYVNVAGNQTVSGQKDWSNLQTFSYGQIRIKSLSQEIGITPATSIIQYLEFADNNNVQHGKVGLWDYDNGASEIQLSISDKYKNGVKDATGTSDTAFLSFGFQYNGTKFLTFSGQVNNSIIPLVTNTYSLGSSSYQWASVYAQTYYYNGTAWGLDKANVWTATQTIKGAPPALHLQSTNIQRGVAPASDSNINLYGSDLNNSELYRLLYRASPTGERRLWIGVNDNYSNGAISPTGSSTWNSLNLYLRADGQAETTFSADVLPETNNKYNLGLSSKKWKTLNGVNPGALSLPDASAKVQIDIPASWVWDGTTENSYVAPITGWLAIGSNQATYVRLFNSMSLIGSVVRSPTSSDMRTYIPMLAGDTILISGITSSSFLIRIYPCLGNV